MMNKKSIVEMLKESDEKRNYYSEMYHFSNEEDSVKYYQPYKLAAADFEARTQMVLAFGYSILRDENGKIIGITRTKKNTILLDENGEIIG